MKEALNAATNEGRKCKRNFEHTLKQHVQSDNKCFYAYVRSKQNVLDKIGPLEANAAKIITGICNGLGIKYEFHFNVLFIAYTRNKVQLV